VVVVSKDSNAVGLTSIHDQQLVQYLSLINGVLRPHSVYEVQGRGLLLPMVRDLCVCLLDITMSCAKTSEPIEMPFGVWTRVGPRNRVQAGDARGKRNFGAPLCDAAFRPLVAVDIDR